MTMFNLIHLIMGTYVEEYYLVLKLYINNTNIGSNRESSPTLQITRQGVVVDWSGALPSNKHINSQLILIFQFLICNNTLCKALYKRLVWLNGLHVQGIPSCS